jgi:hypothetical protein
MMFDKLQFVAVGQELGTSDKLKFCRTMED